MLHRDDERLARFLDLLPKDRRCTVEFRHPSWYEAAVFRILADHDAALCISDHHAAPSPWEVSASLAFVRGDGPGGRYHGRYPPSELVGWSERLEAWRRRGLDLFAYFDNDIKSAAPVDAERLLALMGVTAYEACAGPPEP